MLNIRSDALSVKRIPYHIANRQSLGNLSSLAHRRHYGYAPREYVRRRFPFGRQYPQWPISATGCKGTRGPQGHGAFPRWVGKEMTRGRFWIGDFSSAVCRWHLRFDAKEERRRSVRDRFRLPFREASDVESRRHSRPDGECNSPYEPGGPLQSLGQ